MLCTHIVQKSKARCFFADLFTITVLDYLTIFNKIINHQKQQKSKIKIDPYFQYQLK